MWLSGWAIVDNMIESGCNTAAISLTWTEIESGMKEWKVGGGLDVVCMVVV